MLDRATLERLSKTPEKNAPMLNVNRPLIKIFSSLSNARPVAPEPELDATHASKPTSKVPSG